MWDSTLGFCGLFDVIIKPGHDHLDYPQIEIHRQIMRPTQSAIGTFNVVVSCRRNRPPACLEGNYMAIASAKGSKRVKYTITLFEQSADAVHAFHK